MLERFHRSIAKLIWRGGLLLVVGLATYVSLARLALDVLPQHREAVAAFLGKQLNVGLEVEHLEGQIRGFTPELRLTGLQLTAADKHDADAASLYVTEAKIRFDPWASLLAFQVRPTHLQLAGVELNVTAPGASAAEAEPELAVLSDVFGHFTHVSIIESSIAIRRHDERFVFALDLNMQRLRSQRDIEVVLTAGAGAQLMLTGRGMGNPWALDQFNGQFYVNVSADNLSDITRVVGLDAQGQANLQVWMDIHQGVITTTVDMAFAQATVPLPGHSAGAVQLDSLEGLGLVEVSEQGIQAFFNHMHLTASGSELRVPQINVYYDRPSLSVSVDALDIGRVTSLMLDLGVLPDKVKEVVALLNPEGALQQLVTRIDNVDRPLDSWAAQGQLINATTYPYRNVPGLMGIDAILEANNAGAVAWIDTEDFVLDLPRVYDQPLIFGSVKGALKGRWTRDVLWLEDGVLTAEMPEHNANILFGIDIPLNAEARTKVPLAMYLDVMASGADVAVRHRYIPKTVSPRLDAWLDGAIPQGYANYTAFSWRGGFDGFGTGTQSMQLDVGMRDATVAFHEQWPAAQMADARLLLDTRRLTAWSESGRFGDVAFEGLSVEGNLTQQAAIIDATANFGGEAQALLDVMKTTPIYAVATGVLDDLQADKGTVAGRLQLGLDVLNPGQNPQVAVSADLADIALSSALLGPGVADIQGHLDFDLSQGFTSDDLRVRLLGEPLDISLGQGASGRPGAGIVDAQFAITLPAANVERWLATATGLADIGPQAILSGESRFTGTAAIGESSVITLETDFAATAIDLPAPFGKETSERAPLRLEMNLADNDSWYLFWSARASTDIYRRDGGITGALIDLTPRTQPQALAPPSEPHQVLLTGTLPSLDIEPWLQVWKRLESPKLGQVKSSTAVGSASWATRLGPVNASPSLGAEATTGLSRTATVVPPVGSLVIAGLEVASLQLGETHIGPVQIDMTPHRGWDMVGINADWLDAEFTVHRDNTPSGLIINTLDLDRLPTSMGQPSTTELLPPALSAPINVVLANVYYAGQPLGAAAFRLESNPQALAISDLRGQLAGLRFLPGSALQWSRVANGEYQTRVTVDAALRDVSQLFSDLGREAVMTSRAGAITGVLGWPGSPLDIDSTQLLGDLSLNLQEGSFLPVSPGATGFMRVLSVLNLAGLFQRASVAQLFDPGVTFKRADGAFVFEPGRIVIPRFDVDARGGGFKFNSDIDLLTQTIDGELIVTLPFAENIPWVAALAGGLPVAAGAYLVSKVFEDQVKSLSSGVYSVTGELSQPKVSFERVFDATSTKVRDVDNSGGVEVDSPAAQDNGPGAAQ